MMAATFSMAKAQELEVPEYVMHEAETTYYRFYRWKPEETKVVFNITTDLHHGWWGHHWKKLGWAVETDKLFGYDFMVNLGDIGLNATGQDTEGAWNTICKTKEMMGRFPGVFLYVTGNHDYDAGSGNRFSGADHYNILQRPSERYANGNLHVCKGTCYGYYDIPEKKVRMIFLSSQTESDGRYNFGDAELMWLSKLLSGSPDGWSIAILSHFMPHPLGHWRASINKERPGRDKLLAMLRDFVSCKKGSFENINWNFTGNRAFLVGVFSGDSHAECYTREDGINYFICQGYGVVGPEEGPLTGRYAKVGPDDILTDVVVIAPESRSVKSFRLGAGGEEFDLEFSY